MDEETAKRLRFNDEKTTRIKKFNGGNGAILCNGCRVIVKEGWGDLPYQISTEDWESTEPVLCKKCQLK